MNSVRKAIKIHQCLSTNNIFDTVVILAPKPYRNLLQYKLIRLAPCNVLLKIYIEYLIICPSFLGFTTKKRTFYLKQFPFLKPCGRFCMLRLMTLGVVEITVTCGELKDNVIIFEMI